MKPNPVKDFKIVASTDNLQVSWISPKEGFSFMYEVSYYDQWTQEQQVDTIVISIGRVKLKRKSWYDIL